MSELEQRIDDHVSREPESSPGDCTDCLGVGWLADAQHSCGGDEHRCALYCPEWTQYLCETCEGTGWAIIEIRHDQDGNEILPF